MEPSKSKEPDVSSSSDKQHTLQDEITRLKSELEAASALAQQHRDLYLRTMAEAENVRKRNQRELEQTKEFILEDFFKDLLPVLDSFDKAVEASHSSDEGVGLIHKQLWNLLEKNGLSVVVSDTAFDPSFHMAIQKVECDDILTSSIGQIFSKGYCFRQKLLRPAMVSVKIPKNE